ncbi:MAG: hypothetical protein WAQ24_01085 [Candidatus Saccharimonadales bacterium]
MSYSLVFWNQDNRDDDAQSTYEMLQKGSSLDYVKELPVRKILQTLEHEFREWDRPNSMSFEKDGKGAFQVTMTPHLVEFVCYGMLSEDMNMLIDIMLPFGCFLYDPQVNTRFES